MRIYGCKSKRPLVKTPPIRQNSDVSVTSVTLTLPRLYEVG